MTDKYQRIRDALAMGPTPGPFGASRIYSPGNQELILHLTYKDEYGLHEHYCTVRSRLGGELRAEANAAMISACDPYTIRELLAERDALAKDAAKYRWGINNARWVRSEQEAYVAIPVAPGADLSCVAMRDAAIDAAMRRENKT